jgi:ribosome-associated protein
MLNIEILKDLVLKELEAKKAENIKILDVSNFGIAKYMIFASGKSNKNVSAIAEHVATHIKNTAEIRVGLEGLNNSSWAILDLDGIIVHIFHPETRQYYDVEGIFENKCGH